MKTKQLIILTLVVLLVGLSTASYMVFSNKKPTTPKESFTTYGACSCPPSEDDVPEFKDLKSKEEFERVKAQDAKTKQNCDPTAGCSLGHSITYRYY